MCQGPVAGGSFPGGVDNMSVRCSGMLGVRGTQEPVSGLRYRVGRVISGCSWEERVQEHRKEGRVCAGSQRALGGEAAVRGRDGSRGPGRLGLGVETGAEALGMLRLWGQDGSGGPEEAGARSPDRSGGPGEAGVGVKTGAEALGTLGLWGQDGS